jgi:hypothetical protein
MLFAGVVGTFSVGVWTNNNWVDMAAEGLDFAIRFDRGFLERNRRDPSV